MLRILESKEPFTCRKQFDGSYFSSNTLKQFGFVRFKIDASLNHHTKVGKQITDLLSAALYQFIKIHLHPGWNATYECHVLVNSFINYFMKFGFPVFDAICF